MKLIVKIEWDKNHVTPTIVALENAINRYYFYTAGMYRVTEYVPPERKEKA